MLITELKPKEEILKFLNGKENIFALKCYGCKQVQFPTKEVEGFISELKSGGKKISDLYLDYICNHEFIKKYAQIYSNLINSSDVILVFSCGTGIQSVATNIEKEVQAGTNTMYVNGFQGLVTTEPNCAQCGTCHLNYTSGICPITSCSKFLLNGQCGGMKNGKCEVDKEMDCGWEKIIKKISDTKFKLIEKEEIHFHNHL